MKTLVIILLVIVGIIIGLWCYGYYCAYSDVEFGTSLLVLGIKLQSMNPISRKGYVHYLVNNSDFESRVNDLRSF